MATGSVPLDIAKSEVLKLLPPDTKSIASWVAHNSTGTCFLWNLSSKDLASWVGSKIDPGGDIAVSLDHLPPAGLNSPLASNSATQTNVASIGYGTHLRSDGC
jgi:hypothetical protein